MSTDTTPSPLLSPQDLALELGIPIATIYKWNYSGGGPPLIKVGRHVRYRRGDVDAWLEANTQSGPAA
jgi:excisionase family DNA binding protein